MCDMSNNRFVWVDNARGIGIILVVIGHIFVYPSSFFNQTISKWIYSFHMPLFFFLSGVTFCKDKYSYTGLVKSKAKSLLIPYVVFMIVNYLIYAMAYYVNLKLNLNIEKIHQSGLFKPIIGIFYSRIYDNYLPFTMQPLWYLTCLFFVFIISYSIIKFEVSDYFKFVIFLILSVVFYFLKDVFLPLNIDVAFVVSIFFFCGYIFKKYQIIKYLNVFWIIVFLLINVFVSGLNTFVSPAINSYGNYLLFMISSISGIFCIVKISDAIKVSKILNYYSRNSLIIFLIHMAVIFVIEGIFIILLKLSFINITESFSLCLMVFIITMLCLIPVVYVVGRIFPFLNKKINYKSVKNLK